MQVELHDKFEEALKVSATRLVVYDDYNQPLAFFIQTSPTSVRICTVRDEDFKYQLKQHGIENTVIINRLDAQKIVS
jgi:hypothetical protein